jgi:hypothetical protein
MLGWSELPEKTRGAVRAVTVAVLLVALLWLVNGRYEVAQEAYYGTDVPHRDAAMSYQVWGGLLLWTGWLLGAGIIVGAYRRWQAVPKVGRVVITLSLLLVLGLSCLKVIWYVRFHS